MLGMLFATLYADISPVAPRAKAVAHMRAKPVTRESIVATDIVIVERAIDGLVGVSGCPADDVEMSEMGAPCFGVERPRSRDCASSLTDARQHFLAGEERKHSDTLPSG
jgi:hypothetical protein